MIYIKKHLFFASITIFVVVVIFIYFIAPSKRAERATDPKTDMFGQYVPRGLTRYTTNLLDGYVMFPVTNSASMYLVNRKGAVVHEWRSTYPVLGGYLMSDGAVVLNVLDPDFPIFGGGGESGRIQRISWDSKVLWDFEYATDTHLAHHDIAVMQNGNVLALTYEAKSFDYAVEIGRRPELIPKSGPWFEKIIEIRPSGNRGGDIVWEWRIEDHLVQDFDPKKANFDTVSDHPELLDINVGKPLPPPTTQESIDELKRQGKAGRNETPENKGANIHHFNSIKYDSKRDQILFGSPRINEIFIIDHSTTTKEAAGKTGGKAGKGGDLLYRWGNPKNYGRGTAADQKLFGQHDARWIEDGMPGAGNVLVFNNDNPGVTSDDNFSSVVEISLPINSHGDYVIEDNKAFGPLESTWTYTDKNKARFYSSFISGAHRMKDGNTFINEGAKGRFFEVTQSGETIWEYLTPYRGEIRKLNGDVINPLPMTYIVFRSTFIPADHPGLEGRKLNPVVPQPSVYVLPK